MVRCAALIWVVLGMTSLVSAGDPNGNDVAVRLVQYEGRQSNSIPSKAGGTGNAPQIQIVNDPSSGGIVRFLVDGSEQSLQSGSSMNLSADRSHKVEFNSGGSAGDRRFTVSSGLYRFKVAQDGWMLYRSSSPPVAAAQSASASEVPPPPAPHPELAKRRLAREGATNSAHVTSGLPAPPANASLEGPKPPEPGIVAPKRSATADADSPAPPPVRTPIENVEDVPAPPATAPK